MNKYEIHRGSYEENYKFYIGNFTVRHFQKDTLKGLKCTE